VSKTPTQLKLNDVETTYAGCALRAKDHWYDGGVDWKYLVNTRCNVGPLMVKYGLRFPLGHHLVLEEAHLSGKEMEEVIYMSNLDFSESKPVKILCVPIPTPLLPVTDRAREIIGSALDAAAYRLSLLFEFSFECGPKIGRRVSSIEWS